ncbi:MAG: TerB N-terminal domain-containing protein [Clostridia bacterium]|nr:TerB N-terminal domain-containing protein [Clostridia bacterium]
MTDSKDTERREQSLDEFWDISALIPQKKQATPRASAEIQLTEITYDSREQDIIRPSEETRLTGQRSPHAEKNTGTQTKDSGHSTVITRYIPPHGERPMQSPPTPDDEYVPKSAMLHRVRIYRWKTTYQYYEDFCKHAAALYARRGEPCAPVAFFSYVPQYSQMNRAQLNWYLYWRDRVRSGEILPTDYSYILLYVFEIINLADTVDVREGQKQLCALRSAFRGTYPRLGHLLDEWICDYSLIHHLPPPETSDLSAMSDCTIKEFYVPSTDASHRYATALIAFGSNYAYTKSKFAAGENRALYDKHMPGALCACIADGGEVGARMAGAGLEESRLIRDAYTGALCSHRIKRRIEIDYCSFARSHELRILVTDIMKYTENRLRAYLGVKSRLGLYALPQSFRDCVDRYLQKALPHRERVVKAEARQEYETLYDVPRTALDPKRAAQIEAASWITTERLITAFEDEPQESAKPVSIPAIEPMRIQTDPDPSLDTDEAIVNTSLKEKLTDYMPFINCALREDFAGQRAFAKAHGEMIDSIADRINEIAADVLGDILLEEDDNGYRVIEEYLDLPELQTELETERKIT